MTLVTSCVVILSELDFFGPAYKILIISPFFGSPFAPLEPELGCILDQSTILMPDSGLTPKTPLANSGHPLKITR